MVTLDECLKKINPWETYKEKKLNSKYIVKEVVFNLCKIYLKNERNES
jgi:hypothetical protein